MLITDKSPNSHTIMKLKINLGISIMALGLSACSALKPSNLINLQYTDTEQLMMECQTRSQFTTPYIAGDVIQTERYALISMSAEPPANAQKGELCIIDKRNHHLEITSTDQLSFSS